MKTIIRNLIGIIVGIIVGSIANGLIIAISGQIIAPPHGADVTTTEGLKNSIHLFEPQHYIFPFLAHALGTLIGAITTTKIIDPKKLPFALIVGFTFLLGGISNYFVLGAGAMWFYILDWTVSYIPMSILGFRIMKNR